MKNLGFTFSNERRFLLKTFNYHYVEDQTAEQHLSSLMFSAEIDVNLQDEFAHAEKFGHKVVVDGISNRPKMSMKIVTLLWEMNDNTFLVEMVGGDDNKYSFFEGEYR